MNVEYKLSSYRGYMEVTRPFNSIFLMLITLFTPFIIGTTLNTLEIVQLLFATLSFGLISAGAYALNDYYDIEIDRINKPTRVLPNKVIPPKKARSFGIFLSMLGILISSLVSFIVLFILCVYALILFLYNKKYKKTLFKNPIIGVACSISVIVGGAISGTLNYVSILLIIFIVMTTTSREIYKDIEDIKGDKKLGVFTLPLVKSSEFAFLISSMLLTVVVFLSPIFYFLGFMSLNYVLIILFVNLLFIYCILNPIFKLTNSNKDASKLQKICKIAMMMAFIGLILGRI